MRIPFWHITKYSIRFFIFLQKNNSELKLKKFNISENNIISIKLAQSNSSYICFIHMANCMSNNFHWFQFMNMVYSMQGKISCIFYILSKRLHSSISITVTFHPWQCFIQLQYFIIGASGEPRAQVGTIVKIPKIHLIKWFVNITNILIR